MKNYTSLVDPARSIAKIEQLLISHGARSIAKEYGEGQNVIAITFVIKNPETQLPVMIRMPSDPDGVFSYFKSLRKKPLQKNQVEKLRVQSLRTAWKLTQDWIEVQLSMVEMKQAEPAEVFLPYIWNGQTTLFHQMKTNQTPCIGYKGGDEPSDSGDEAG